MGEAPAAGGGDLAEGAQGDAEVHLAPHRGKEVDRAADGVARPGEIALVQVRLAMAAQRLGEDSVTVAFLGDGATS